MASASPFQKLPADPDLPKLEEEVLALWEKLDAFRESNRRRKGGPEFRLLRRPAVRDRHAALRAPAGRHDQGHRAALLVDARLRRRAPLRLGLPRPAHREPRARSARPERRARDPRARRRRLQRAVPLDGAALRLGVAQHRHAHGALGRLRQRLQDHGHRRSWSRCGGSSSSSGTRGASTRRTASCPTAGSSATPLSNFEASANYKDVQDPAHHRALSARRRRSAAGVARRTCSPGRRLPGRFRRISRSASGPTSTTRSFATQRAASIGVLASERLAAYYPKSRGLRARAHASAARSSWASATSRSFRISPTQPNAFRGARGRLRHAPPTAPASSTWRPPTARTTIRVCRARGHRARRPARRRVPLHRRRARAPGPALQGRRQGHHQAPEGRGQARPPRHDRAQLPLRRAHRHAAHLPRDRRLVRAASRTCASAWSRTTRPCTGCRKPSARTASATGCKDARDWNISRNRFWGSCIPVWIAEDGSGHRSASARSRELEELSGVRRSPICTSTDRSTSRVHEGRQDAIGARPRCSTAGSSRARCPTRRTTTRSRTRSASTRRSPGGLHRRGARSDARLVLHAARAFARRCSTSPRSRT